MAGAGSESEVGVKTVVEIGKRGDLYGPFDFAQGRGNSKSDCRNSKRRVDDGSGADVHHEEHEVRSPETKAYLRCKVVRMCGRFTSTKEMRPSVAEAMASKEVARSTGSASSPQASSGRAARFGVNCGHGYRRRQGRTDGPRF